MKLNEILENWKPLAKNEFDRVGSPMDLPNMYKVKDIGSKTTVKPKTVTVRNSKTGQVYGRRTIMSK